MREQITHAAMTLFLARGYDATTIDDIATEVGMSQRSVFRYFATKESIVIAKLEVGMQRLLDGLRTRPADEVPWEALCRVLTSETVDGQSGAGGTSDLAMLRMVFETPGLMSVYLLRLHQLQRDLADVVRQRALAAGPPPPDHDPAPAALVAAALGCLVAAQQQALDFPEPRPFGDLIALSLQAVGPAVGGELES